MSQRCDVIFLLGREAQAERATPGAMRIRQAEGNENIYSAKKAGQGNLQV